ncbi:tetraspanin-14 isoform X2 [Parasteatoda tepidariorum]|uniref:tetraspanin-14 isoform X2 n=1 Tax=Parasteatoda tepidariorum TaxID=114398 RepID=UPI001C728C84|nr:tetraspanin-14 isoform X2 [Parasteatoda tepidariorum]
MLNMIRYSEDYISSYTKYSLFFFNLIFWFVGGAVVAIGGWSFLEEYNFKGLPQVNSAFELFVHVSIVIMVFGGIVFIISFGGCLGALRENLCLLKCYSFTLLLLFIGEMALTVFAFVFPNKFVDLLKVGGLSKELIVKYRDDANLQNVIDALQTEFLCCGISDEGYKDWSKNIYFNCSTQNLSPERCAVPYSCCRNPHNIESVTNAAEFIFARGCIEAIQDYIVHNLHLVAGIFLVVSLIQLFAMYLCKSLLAQINAQISQWR